MKKSILGTYAAQNFPSWSEARRNPLSVVKIIANTLGWAVDNIEYMSNNLLTLNYLRRINPLTEPWHGYVTPAYGYTLNEADVDWEDALSKVPTRDLIGIIGDESDQTEPVYHVNITLVDTLNEYLNGYPTDYYVETKIPINGTNKYIPNITDNNGHPVTYATAARIFSVIDNTMYIMLDYTKGKPSYIEVHIPEEFYFGEMEQPRIYNENGDIIEEEMGEVYGGPYTQDEAVGFYIDNGEYLEFEEHNDPLITKVSNKFTISGKSKQVLVPHYILDGTISATNTNDNSTEQVTIEYTNDNFTTEGYIEEYDFNRDGIIDDYDYNELLYNVGKSMSDYTEKEWMENYAKYDLNKNGEIDESDIEIFIKSKNTVIQHGTIIKFQNNGIFNVKYEMIENGLTEAILDINNNPFYLPTRKYIDHPEILPYPEEWKFGSKSDLLDTYIYLNKAEHKLILIKYDDMLENTVKDKWEIYLPLLTKDDRVISIDIDNNDLYVLMYYNGKYVIIKYELDGNINDEYVIRYIHSNKIDKIGVEKKIRDKEGLYDPIGIKVMNKDLILVVDRIGNGFLNIKLLRGIYDYAMIDTFHENGKNTLFTREKYDKLKSGENVLQQVYYHIWNRFDDFAFELGLYRIPGEGNINLRKRIFNYLDNFPDPTKEMIEMEIHREFMIDDQAFISDHAIWGESIWGTVTWG